MNTFKRTAGIVGVLFLTGMVAGITGNILIQPITGAPDYLVSLSGSSMIVAIGAMLMLFTSIGDATHGILMYPLLKRHHAQLAVGYLGFRIVNATFLGIQVLLILVQIPLAEAYVHAEVMDKPMLQSMGTLFIHAHLYGYQLAMIFLGLAGSLLCYLLKETGMLPRWLAYWGFFGYIIMFFGSVLEAMGYDLQLMHTLPGGLWELFIGVWLIVRGFKGIHLDADKISGESIIAKT